MAIFQIHHITRYTYEQPAGYSANQIILYPIKDEWQRVKQQRLLISGEPVVAMHHDYFGNQVGTFTLIEPHTELVIDSHITVETTARLKPQITQSTHEQWEELSKMAALLPYADYLKLEAFDSREELQQMINA